MIRLCIFDMDGLLIDSERCMWIPNEAIAAKEQGYNLTDEIHIKYMGMNLADAGKVLEKEFPGIDIDKFYERTFELNQKTIEKGIPLTKGAKDLLMYLKNSDIKTCIGTSTIKEHAYKILEIIGIKDMFDEIVCGDEISNGKPAPDIYLKCLSKFDINKEEVIVLEDADSGGKAALAAGIKLVLVPDLAYISEDTKSKAYKILDSLTEGIEFVRKENERTTSV